MTTSKAQAGSRKRNEVTVRRLRTGLIIAVTLLLILGGRLFQVQALDLDGMAQEAVNKRLKTTTVQPLRGQILDSKGRVLARSVQRFDIVVDQNLVQDYKRRSADATEREAVTVDQAVSELAAALGQSEQQVRGTLLGTKPYNVVAKSVTPEVKDKVMAVGVPGMYANALSERSYPNGSLAGSVIGFMGSDGEPLSGIELSQKDKLVGTAGERTFEIGGDGIRIPNATYSETPAMDGQSVRLTIDEDIQWFAQEAIAAKVKEFGAQGGNVIVMNAKTGDLLAIAESTTPDPNNPGATPEEFRLPTAITKSYEPGSTGKIPTLAAAIEEGITTPQSQYELPPKLAIGGQVIDDAVAHGVEHKTTAGILAKSLNTGTVMIGSQLSKQQQYDWLRKFGVGEKIDVGIQGAASGILAKPEKWDGRQRYTVLFGQGYAITAMHNAQIFQTLANNGIKVKPRLIDAYIAPDGTETVVPREEGTRVVSASTADQMQDLMETVVAVGTGKRAAVEGYRVGGKTGTGEAAGPSGGYDGYTISFGGMAPMEDPQFVAVATIYRPQGAILTRTTTPVFSEVMGKLLSAYHVPPSTTEPVSLPTDY